ncbi:MAG: Uma2 family endonuclease, partial [Pseudomonadota bacterium]
MAQMPTTLSTEVTPDSICEVLSPSTARHDRGIKFDHYARLGVGYYWIVDLARQRIETWANEGSGWVHGPCAENDETVFLPP